MNVQTFVDTIVSFVRDHEAWAIPIAFIVAFAESFCFFSILWPGTAILVAVSALIAASGISYTVVLPMILAAGLGGSLGYAVSYWIGLYFKDSIPGIWPFTRHRDLIPKGQRFFDKYGLFGVFLGHFFGPVRAIIPVVAGMFRMKQVPFQIANFSSAFLWAGGVIAPSFFLVSHREEVFQFLRDNEILVAGIMFLLAVAAAIPHLVSFWPALFGFVALGAVQLFAGGNFVPLLLAGALGAFVGDLLLYRAGHGRTAPASAAWWVSAEEPDIDASRTRLAQQGPLSLVTSKIGGLNRAYTPLVAGITEMQLTSFVGASVAGSLLWSGFSLLPRPVASLLGF